MAKALEKQKAMSDGGKVLAKANDLRRQGATFAIICHTLNIPYTQAVALGKAYDKAHGNHVPQKLVRNASDIRLTGYTVKDGRGIASAKGVGGTNKTKPTKAKATTAKSA